MCSVLVSSDGGGSCRGWERVKWLDIIVPPWILCQFLGQVVILFLVLPASIKLYSNRNIWAFSSNSRSDGGLYCVWVRPFDLATLYLITVVTGFSITRLLLIPTCTHSRVVDLAPIFHAETQFVGTI